MEVKKMIIKGKTGGPCEYVHYVIKHDELGLKWLYLTRKFNKLVTDILIGMVEAENNRGIKVVSHGLTGKPLNFYLDRQYFDFVELKK